MSSADSTGCWSTSVYQSANSSWLICIQRTTASLPWSLDPAKLAGLLDETDLVLVQSEVS